MLLLNSWECFAACKECTVLRDDMNGMRPHRKWTDSCHALQEARTPELYCAAHVSHKVRTQERGSDLTENFNTCNDFSFLTPGIWCFFGLFFGVTGGLRCWKHIYWVNAAQSKNKLYETTLEQVVLAIPNRLISSLCFCSYWLHLPPVRSALWAAPLLQRHCSPRKPAERPSCDATERQRTDGTGIF